MFRTNVGQDKRRKGQMLDSTNLVKEANVRRTNVGQDKLWTVQMYFRRTHVRRTNVGQDKRRNSRNAEKKKR